MRPDHCGKVCCKSVHLSSPFARFTPVSLALKSRMTRSGGLERMGQRCTSLEKRLTDQQASYNCVVNTLRRTSSMLVW